MQKEPIFIPNIKFVFLDKPTYSNIFKIHLPNSTSEEKLKYIKDVEALGIPFFMITEESLRVLGDDYSNHPLKYTKEFKELFNPFSPLDNYLRKAKIEFTLSKRADGKTQYLGLVAGIPLSIESIVRIDKKEREFGKYAVPCQFYNIKDNLDDLGDRLIKPPVFCPTH
jgi:hypothetical protein